MPLCTSAAQNASHYPGTRRTRRSKRGAGMKKPTDRELGLLLREITGRTPAMPRQEGEVRIAKTTYNGADRFELTWRDAANSQRKLWYRNWRHAIAAAKWANAQIEAAKGKTSFTFGDAAKGYLDWCERRSKAK